MISDQKPQYLVLAACLAVSVGCASDALNLDRYRDERATDIESRLTRDEPVVKSPFGKAEEKEN